jgi:hypothetical protein
MLSTPSQSDCGTERKQKLASRLSQEDRTREIDHLYISTVQDHVYVGELSSFQEDSSLGNALQRFGVISGIGDIRAVKLNWFRFDLIFD